MSANKTMVTSKEIAEAMEYCRTCKAIWQSKVESVDASRREECNALNAYNESKKLFETLVSKVIGEHEK